MNPFNTLASQSDSIGSMDSHLSEDQFADCLLGCEPTPECAAHLTQCAACRDELATFGTSVATFGSASLAWSESRPMPSLLHASQAHAQRPFLTAASWALAVCTLLVFGASAVMHHQQLERNATVASVDASPQDSDAEIAQDNKLLLEVDQSLRNNVSSPVQEYGLGSTAPPRTGPHAEARIQ